MQWHLCDEVVTPTSDVGHALRISEVCLLPSQFLCKQLLLCDVNCGAVKPFENAIFHNRNTHAANVAQLPVWSNNSFCYVAATVLLKHRLDHFSHGSSVLWMNEGQMLLNRGGPVPRV